MFDCAPSQPYRCNEALFGASLTSQRCCKKSWTLSKNCYWCPYPRRSGADFADGISTHSCRRSCHVLYWKLFESYSYCNWYSRITTHSSVQPNHVDKPLHELRHISETTTVRKGLENLGTTSPRSIKRKVMVYGNATLFFRCKSTY